MSKPSGDCHNIILLWVLKKQLPWKEKLPQLLGDFMKIISCSATSSIQRFAMNLGLLPEVTATQANSICWMGTEPKKSIGISPQKTGGKPWFKIIYSRASSSSEMVQVPELSLPVKTLQAGLLRIQPSEFGCRAKLYIQMAIEIGKTKQMPGYRHTPN